MLAKLHKIFDALTERERQIFQGTLLVFLVALIFNGINLFYQGTKVTPIEGGSYTEGLVGQPIALNPVLASNNDVDHDLIELLFQDLSELTEEIKASDDLKTWTVKIKSGVFWSDGEPLSGDDVVFTLQTIQNQEAHSPLISSWQGVKFEKISGSELKFSLKAPYAFFSENLENLKLLPKHIFGAIPASNLRISDYNFEPVSNGPYAFKGLVKLKNGFISQYNFSANQFYGGERPLIADLAIKFFSSYDEAIAAFNRKEIDGLGGIFLEDAEKIKIGFTLREINLPRYYAIFFNPATAPALKEPEVRQALGLSTDRKKFVNEIFKGSALSVYGPIFPGLEGYEAALETKTEFSLVKAEEILRENKWQKDDAGVMTKKKGNAELKLNFEIVVPKIDFLIRTVETIVNDWQSIGVKLTPVIMETADIVREVIKARSYEMIIFGNILKTSPDVFSFWHSSERFYPGLNLSIYENPTVDELLTAIRRTKNESQRIRDIKKLQGLIEEDRPAIFLFSPNYLYASPKNLGGFNAKFMAKQSDRFNEINKWYLKTARVFK